MKRSPKNPLASKLAPLMVRGKGSLLEGRPGDGDRWEFEVEENPPAWLIRDLPVGLLIFANNGFGDHLFIRPESDPVYAYWHDGPEIEEYCPSIQDLLPKTPIKSSGHPTIFYSGTQNPIKPGDRVLAKCFLLFRNRGVITYVPGVSHLNKDLEYGEIARLRIRLDDGADLDITVVNGRPYNTIQLLKRPGDEHGSHPVDGKRKGNHA